MLLELLFTMTAHASNFDDYPACKSVQSKNVPNRDLPSKDEVEKLKGCDAKNAYYGIGEPIDHKKARLCSFAQCENEESKFWGGATILYMIYANGYGVSRNLDVALKYACELQQAPAEIDSRIKRIESLRKESERKEADPKNRCL